MAELDKRPVTLEELLVSSLAQTDALAKLLIEKGLVAREESARADSDLPCQTATVSPEEAVYFSVSADSTWDCAVDVEIRP